MPANTKKVVGLFFGGRSGEHDVSLTSASSLLKEIDKDLFEVIPILITQTGKWFFVEDTDFLLKNTKEFICKEDYDTKKMFPVILDYTNPGVLISPSYSQKLPKLDIAFPLLHGIYGEDGIMQGFCHMGDLPCVGASLLGSALGFDKIIAKLLVEMKLIPVVPYLHFTKKEWKRNSEKITQDICSKLFLPVFVKPANSGSSVGITKVHEKGDLAKAVLEALLYDRKILVEKAIHCRELECAILGNHDANASVVGEVIPEREFYDYQAKYLEESSKIIIPAKIPTAISEKVREYSLKVFSILNCTGFARVDFLMDKKTNQLYFNEINTIPGFTPKSMFPMLWQACNVSYSELITRLLELAIEDFQDRNF